MSRDVTSREVQDIVDRLMNLLDKEDCPEMDLGENYWNVLIDGYLHNPELIKGMDKRYGTGASRFMGRHCSIIWIIWMAGMTLIREKVKEKP